MKTKANSGFDCYSNEERDALIEERREIASKLDAFIADTRHRVPRTSVTEKFHSYIDELERLNEQFRRETEGESHQPAVRGG